MKIKYKFGGMILLLSLVVISMFVVTLSVTNKQKDDGLVINLAGRQRMLTQKMTKEVLDYHAKMINKKLKGLDNLSLEKEIWDIKNSAKIFDVTLNALTESGRAPLDLNFEKSKFRECPKAKEPAYSQLKKVEKIWKKFHSAIKKVISNSGDYTKELNHILNNNVLLLKEMNKVVIMMQKQSEEKVDFLIKFQQICIFIEIVMLFFSFLIVMNIVKSLSKVEKFVTRLGTGDLTSEISISTNDELGIIGKTLNDTVKKLSDMFGNIRNNTVILTNSAKEYIKISDEMLQSTNNVSQKSQTVAVASEEMSANMNSVAAAVEEASVNISLVANAAKDMSSTIEEIAKNTEVARNITSEAVVVASQSTTRVNELGSAASEIGKVTETITEISEQTNLLALNATIEAARAGEAGKGFAVVANEIKELAKQTSLATQEIKQKIDGIQTSTFSTVEEIENISKIIDQVNDIVATISAAVEEQSVTTKEIADNVSQASIGIQDVSQNVSHTSMVSKEVAQDIAEVSVAATQMSANGIEVKNTAGELEELAKKLDELVNKFKIK